MLPHDFPPWTAVYQQACRWFDAGVFEAVAHELRVVVRMIEGRESHPTGTIFEARTLQSTPESGGWAGFDGHKKRKGSNVHAAVDTLGKLLAPIVTPANENERGQVDALAARVQEVTGEAVEIAYVDQGYTGEAAAGAAEEKGITLVVVKHHEPKKGFVLLPKRWVERTFGWLGRFRRLARDYEQLAETLKGWHWLATLVLLLVKVNIESQ